LRKQLEVMEKHTDTRTWMAANTEFHAAVYKRANRPRMIELVERLRGLTDRYLYLQPRRTAGGACIVRLAGLPELEVGNPILPA